MNTTLQLPSVWHDLLYIHEFECWPGGVKDGKQQAHALDDPNPYSDDCREINASFTNGNIVFARLCSRRSNYWLEFRIVDPAGKVVYESVPYDDIADTLETFQGGDGVEYHVGVEMVGR